MAAFGGILRIERLKSSRIPKLSVFEVVQLIIGMYNYEDLKSLPEELKRLRSFLSMLTLWSLSASWNYSKVSLTLIYFSLSAVKN